MIRERQTFRTSQRTEALEIYQRQRRRHRPHGLLEQVYSLSSDQSDSGTEEDREGKQEVADSLAEAKSYWR